MRSFFSPLDFHSISTKEAPTAASNTPKTAAKEKKDEQTTMNNTKNKITNNYTRFSFIKMKKNVLFTLDLFVDADAVVVIVVFLVSLSISRVN